MKRHSPQAALLVAALLLTPLTASAGPGHDHGDEAAVAVGEAAARFVAVSDVFELVGILEGRRITLYLDRTADNSPVRDARIELEIGGTTFKAQASKGRQGDDEYSIELAAVPAPGVLPVTATVVAGNETDLLAGELDIHEEAHADEAAPAPSWRRIAAWAVGGLGALALLVWVVRRSKGRRSVRVGGVA